MYVLCMYVLSCVWRTCCPKATDSLTEIKSTPVHLLSLLQPLPQVNNRILFEGVLKIYWGVKNALILAPGAAYAKQRHNRQSIYDFVGVDDGAYLMMLEEASKARMRRELQEGEKKRLREITENSVLMSSAGLSAGVGGQACVIYDIDI